MNRSNNRRAWMTKRILQDSLLNLLQANHITEISIKRLCEEADMNRSTFYAHYQNQMEVLHEIEEETYQKVQDFMLSGIRSPGSADSVKIFEQLLTYIREQRGLFLILLGQNGSQDFQKKLMELTDKAATKSGFSSAEGERNLYMKLYRIAGCTRVIEEWIKQDFDQPINKMAKLLVNLSGE